MRSCYRDLSAFGDSNKYFDKNSLLKIMQKNIDYSLEVPMSDVKDTKKQEAPAKPMHKVTQDSSTELKPQHKVGLVEIVMILLLAGVIFIFVFGMSQMKKEKAQELALQQKFEKVLPTFATITQAAKEYQAADPFAAWPLSIEEMNLPKDINTPEFTFTFAENGIVILTTTKAFGKEGIKVSYDIAKDGFDIEDPTPDAKPNIKETWLNR